MIQIIRLEVPDSIELRNHKVSIFRIFTQTMLNRLVVGEARYGPWSKKRKAVTRLTKELAAYKKTGNAEHLFNIANYCVLEYIDPEHPKHHFDPTVDSVTRNETK